MRNKIFPFLPVWLLAGCDRLYVPVTLWLPPDPPSPGSGWSTGVEGGEIPGQYPGETGRGMAIYRSAVYMARFFRAEIVASLWGGTYRFTDPSFQGTTYFFNLWGSLRGSLLLPLKDVRLEAGPGMQNAYQFWAPKGVDVFPGAYFWAYHFGAGLPGKFWARVHSSEKITAFSLTMNLWKGLWMGGSAMTWRQNPQRRYVRFSVVWRKSGGRKREPRAENVGSATGGEK